MVQLREHAYLFIGLLSMLLAVVCALVGLYIGDTRVMIMGVLYFMFTLTGMLIAIVLPTEGGDHVLAYFGSFLALLLTAFLTLPFTQFQIMGMLEITEWPTDILAVTMPIPPQLIVTILIQVVTGTAEESLFRPFGITIAKPVLGSTGAITCMGIIFGFMHWPAYQMALPQVVTACISGFELGYIYDKTKSAVGVSLAHTSFNLTALLARAILFGILPGA